SATRITQPPCSRQSVPADAPSNVLCSIFVFAVECTAKTGSMLIHRKSARRRDFTSGVCCCLPPSSYLWLRPIVALARKRCPSSPAEICSNVLSCRCNITHKTVRDDCGHPKGARSPKCRTESHFAFDWRARLRYAGQYQKGGDGRNRARRDQIYAGCRYTTLARGDCPKIQARKWA